MGQSTTKFTRAQIEARVRRDASGCWIWTGSIGATGYGRVGNRYMHRAFYEMYVGPIPEGLQVDHLCRVRACVNPAHLEPVTNRENVIRGLSPIQLRERHAARTHCKRGHPFDLLNTKWHAKGRSCRACDNDFRRIRRAAGKRG